jgi:ABC-type Fe3+-siderophore transport system permease subunit
MRANVTLRGMAVVAAIAALCAPWIGPSLADDAGRFVLLELRLPRALLGVLAGAMLGASGAAMQVVLENPLAAPSTVGTTAGAGMGALAVLLLWPTGGAWAVAAGALCGALAISGALAAAARQQRLGSDDLILAGVALSLAAGAITTGLQLRADATTTLASVRWALGSLSTVGYDRVLVLAPPVVVALFGLHLQLPALAAMTSGTDVAASRGVDVVTVRTRVLGATALGVAATVAVVGPIGFVGLILPHAVRGLGGSHPTRLLPYAAVLGAGFLPFADAVGRAISPTRDLPVGVLTAALGAPTLVALLIRRRRERT